MSSFRYLDNFVKEALRMHPIVPFLAKKAARDTELMGYPVPAHADVFIDVYGMQRDPKYWGADAGEFKPERWTSDFVPVEGSYIPFGDGLCTINVYSLCRTDELYRAEASDD